MFRLLALVATTLAAPQYYYPQYAGYPPYGVVPRVAYNPVYGTTYQPVAYPLVQAGPSAGDNTRAFFGASALMVRNQNFVAATAASNGAAAPDTTTAAQVIVGTVEITQNALTNLLFNNDAQFKIYVQSSGTLDLTGQNIILGFAADCITPATAANRFTTINAPAQFNGFYISGATTGFNIDAMNGKTSVNGNRVQILDAAGTTVIGCTAAVLN